MEFLTTKEVAAFLSLSYRTLEKWRSIGVGPPYVRMGADRGLRKNAVRYRKDLLLEWVAEGLVTNDPAAA